MPINVTWPPYNGTIGALIAVITLIVAIGMMIAGRGDWHLWLAVAALCVARLT